MSALRRRVLPRLVVALSRVDRPARVRAALRRVLRRPGVVELYFAFDDPCSAIAVLDLVERCRGRRVELDLRPVVRRGIPGDPAVEWKREHTIEDARRLARRHGRTLTRESPIAAGDVAHLAAQAMAFGGEERVAFCAETVARLWLAEGAAQLTEAAPGGEAVAREDAAASPGDAPVRANERRMARRGPYDTPAAWVAGRWFFAHDRGPQIGDWLDRLGWTAR